MPGNGVRHPRSTPAEAYKSRCLKTTTLWAMTSRPRDAPERRGSVNRLTTRGPIRTAPVKRAANQRPRLQVSFCARDCFDAADKDVRRGGHLLVKVRFCEYALVPTREPLAFAAFAAYERSCLPPPPPPLHCLFLASAWREYRSRAHVKNASG